MMSKKHSGFTLIELMVVIAIMGLVVGFSYQSFRVNYHNQMLQKNLRLVKGAVYQAKQDALFGKRPAACDHAFDGNLVRFVASNRIVEVRANCEDPSNNPITPLITSVTLDTGISMTTNPAMGSFRFNNVVRGTSLGSDLTVSMTNRLAESDSFIVTTLGEIQ